MADGSEPVVAPYENPAGAPPINARPYDFGALTPSQQGALNRLKLRMLRDDQTYLAEHPQANIQHVYNTLSLDSGAGGYFNVQEWVAHMLLFSGVGGVVSLLLREVCHAKPRRAHEFMANHVAKPAFNAELGAYLNDKISADRNCDRPGVSCPVCVPPTSDASPGAGQRDEPTETRWQSSTTTTVVEPEEVELPEGDEYSPRYEDNVVEEEEEEEELNLEGFLGRRESDHDGVRVWRHHAKRADGRLRRSLDGEPVGGARRPSLGVRARRDSVELDTTSALANFPTKAGHANKTQPALREQQCSLYLAVPPSFPPLSYVRMRTTVKHHVSGTVKRTVPYKDLWEYRVLTSHTLYSGCKMSRTHYICPLINVLPGISHYCSVHSPCLGEYRVLTSHTLYSGCKMSGTHYHYLLHYSRI
uniref:Uncharacterized protein n=1 Tax=Timema douglasi TaxID=61478 RepID=A0A7R8VU57_TIMDO|nr:unnamed protein product [Timema douglasi]